MAATNVTSDTSRRRKVHWRAPPGVGLHPPMDEVPLPLFSSISVGSPGSAHDDGSAVKTDGNGHCGLSFSTTLDLGGQFLWMGEDSVVVLDTGAAANSAC